MNYIGKFISNFKDFYNEINSATLTGAIDVVVIKQPDGTYLCSPFHVRFGKIGVLRSREKVVDIEVNGSPVDIQMKLGDSGEAFFVQEVEDENDIMETTNEILLGWFLDRQLTKSICFTVEECTSTYQCMDSNNALVPLHLATSPIPPAPDIGEELKKMKLLPDYIDNNTNEQTSLDGQNASGSLFGRSQDGSVNIENISAVDTSITMISSDSAMCDKSFTSSPNDAFCLPQNFKSLCDTNKDVSIAIQTDLFNSKTSMPVDSETVETLGTDFDTLNISLEDCKSKRKKKKKSTSKRTRSREVTILSATVNLELRNRTSLDQDNHSSERSDEGTDKQEDIFPMDDDYTNEEDEGFPSLNRSISLPLSGNQFVHADWPIRKMSSTFTGEFHPFSDGDVTPQASPSGSRPPSPKSDTEYEIKKFDATSQTDSHEPIWGWGQLPYVPRRLSDVQLPSEPKTDLPSNLDENTKTEGNTDAEKRSMLGGMWNFMRSTRKLRHMPESEGIYLDDINPNELDPEVAALYFPKFKSSYYPQSDIKSTVRDEDAESGNGPSLPHSPHSVIGAIGGQDSDSDDRQSFDFYSDIAMSLCGGLQDFEAELPEDKFLNSVVTYDEFTENPGILQNPNLVIKFNGKYYNWLTVAPMLLSIIMFQRQLPEKTTNRLIGEHMPKKKKSKSYSSWWYWRRSADEIKTPDPVHSPSQPTCEVPQVSENEVSERQEKDILIAGEGIASNGKMDSSSPLHTGPMTCNSHNPPVTPDNMLNGKDFVIELSVENVVESALKQSVNKTEVILTCPSSNSSSPRTSPLAVGVDIPRSEDGLSANGVNVNLLEASKSGFRKSKSHAEKYKKSLRLSSEQIAKLNLKNGPNEVVFSVTTAYQGTTRCKCHIYLWSYDDKIVISDIDGTITKSDVLGHILPIIGKDWAQLGVAKLFTKVKNNGYQFLYLSARAIGQARITREYLRSVRQGDVCLPDGPLLLSPTSLISALHREVIERKPEEFKIRCLKDVQTLFPLFMGNPFYAGFGNKINDTWAYRAVGIPITRVFTINHRGELKLELIQTFQSSYTRLSDVVDHMFPPLERCVTINGHLAPSFTSSEEYSYFTYWREPVAAVCEEDLDI